MLKDDSDGDNNDQNNNIDIDNNSNIAIDNNNNISKNINIVNNIDSNIDSNNNSNKNNAVGTIANNDDFPSTDVNNNGIDKQKTHDEGGASVVIFEEVLAERSKITSNTKKNTNNIDNSNTNNNNNNNNNSNNNHCSGILIEPKATHVVSFDKERMETTDKDIKESVKAKRKLNPRVSFDEYLGESGNKIDSCK